MNENLKTKFRVDTYKLDDGLWNLGFGIHLCSMDAEKYLYVNLFKWHISIGFLYDDTN